MHHNKTISQPFLGIDLLKHLFAIAVILMHMHSYARYSETTNQDLLGLSDYIDGAVFGFFLISGYLFKLQSSILGYIKKQAVRLLVPFILFSILYTSIFVLIGKIEVIEGIKKALFLHGVGMQLYFLPYLFLISVVYACVYEKLGLRKNNVHLVFLILIILISIFLPTESSTGAHWKLLPFYFSAYVIGRVLKIYDTSNNFWGVLITVLSILIGFVDNRFFDLAVVLFLFIFIKYFFLLKTIRLPGSGGVYLLHTPLINFSISIFLDYLGLHQKWNIFASVLVTYIFCLMFTLLVIRFFPKYKWLLLE